MNSENLIQYYGLTSEFPKCSKAFKQLQIQDIMHIPSRKPDIEQITGINVKIEITHTKIINTITGISREGQNMTGKKLIIEGKLQQKLEYVANSPDQPVHSAHFTVPFSSFVMLGEDTECYEEYQVDGYIEDIYVKQIDSRKTFKNVLFVLNAKPLSRV